MTVRALCRFIYSFVRPQIEGRAIARTLLNMQRRNQRGRTHPPAERDERCTGSSALIYKGLAELCYYFTLQSLTRQGYFVNRTSLLFMNKCLRLKALKNVSISGSIQLSIIPLRRAHANLKVCFCLKDEKVNRFYAISF